jgi:voltage-gated potassium channel Kch
MTIPAPDDPAVVLVAVLIATLALLSRFVVMLPVLHLSGLDRRNATLTSTRLVPISEFALVIAFLGMQLGHVDAALNAAIVFAFVITAVASPWTFKGADRCYRALAPLLGRIGFKAPPATSGEGVEKYDLALLGVHRTGSSLLYELQQVAPDLMARTLVVDFNVNIHPRIAALGPHVVYGDFTSAETLRHAGVDRSRVVLCTIPDDVLSSGSTRDVVLTVRSICPRVFLVATAVTFAEVRALYQAGADYVLVPRLDAARAAVEAVQAALNGQIDTLRVASATVPDRKEVLD